MTSTIVKISILAVAVFAVAGLVFAGIGQSASAFLNNNGNGHNHNSQHNNCSDDCGSLAAQTKTTKVQVAAPVTALQVNPIFFYLQFVQILDFIFLNITSILVVVYRLMPC